ncbi:hypothetical protein E2C01_033855 [Portunus trituberculatus]|uniref:Uncharacterized protein n=1 Tax=Portunus trituberculatus TaxID=210409 RepID=A0A5B7F4V2_PORTR|nr:hypothetical protein [Portunus trituberculatus]
MKTAGREAKGLFASSYKVSRVQYQDYHTSRLVTLPSPEPPSKIKQDKDVTKGNVVAPWIPGFIGYYHYYYDDSLNPEPEDLSHPIPMYFMN